MTQKFDIEVYEDDRGKAPFSDWILKLKDKLAQAKLHSRVDRASLGNFGDWKDIKGAKGIYEMREHYGPGYRIFYTITGKTVVLLLAGSTKRDQNKAIVKAKKYLAEYERRKNHGTADKTI